MQLSNLIGKQILSPAGEAYGYVLSALPTKDLSKLSSLVAVDAEEEEFCIPARAILSIDDAVIAGRMRIDAPTGIPSPIGREVFSYTGEYLGAVCDLLLGDGSEAILVVTRDGVRTTAAAACAIFGEHIVLYLDKEARDAAAKSGGKKKASLPRAAVQREFTQKAELAPAEDTAAPPKQSVPIKEEPPKPKENTITAPPQNEEKTKDGPPMSKEEPKDPNAVRLLNNTNLLGRTVKRSVFDNFGRPVALAGERITPAHLARARLAGRLLALTVNTLTLF